MKKKLIIFLLMIICAIPFSLGIEKCQNVYCNEFDYICCCTFTENGNPVPKLQEYNPDTNKVPPMCPSEIDVKECEFSLSLSTGYTMFIGSGTMSAHSQGCGLLNLKTCKRWKFSIEQVYDIVEGTTPTYTLKPGQYIYTWNGNTVSVDSIVIKKYDLKRTGRAGGCEGTTVQGSVGCTFNPSNSGSRIYDEENSKSITTQFSLDERECYRITSDGDKRVCGNTCDECASDIDCASSYPKTYSYNGRSLGGMCQNGQITLYGCENTAKKECVYFDDLNKNGIYDSNEECHEWKNKKECQLVKTLSTGIECCTSDDCQGAGDYFCNWISDIESKCSLKAQCSTDKDCGLSDKCDSTSRELKRPTCDTNKQCVDKVIEKVDCCTTNDCTDSTYCTSDYTCNSKPQTAASLQASSGSTSGGDINSKKSNNGSGIILIITLLIAGGGVGYYVYTRKKGAPIEHKIKAHKEHTLKHETHKDNKENIYCHKCGATLDAEDSFCTKCGAKK